MRAVLIVNPTATSTTPAGRDLLAHALKSRLQLTVEHTSHRGHAAELAHAAAEDGIDVIVVHGGDGTGSGGVNGLLGRPGAATNQVIQLLDDYRRHQTWRRIGLIDCGERWALVNAGMGIDAEVVAGV